MLVGKGLGPVFSFITAGMNSPLVRHKTHWLAPGLGTLFLPRRASADSVSEGKPGRIPLFPEGCGRDVGQLGDQPEGGVILAPDKYIGHI